MRTKVAVIKIITASDLEKFRRDGIDTLIFSRVDKSVSFELLKDYTLINAFKNTTEANWYNYNLITEQLRRLNTGVPGIFNYKGYNLEEALNKDFFWSYLFTNAALFQLGKLTNPSVIFYDERSGLKKKLALFKKLFLYKHAGYTTDTNVPVKDIEKKIGFRLNDPFMIDVYGKIFETLGKEQVLPFQTIYNHYSATVNKQMLDTFGLNFKAQPQLKNPFQLSVVNKLKLLFGSEDADFLNTLVYLQNTLCNHVDEYERLFKAGVKKIVLNAGENEGEGNVACMTAEKHGALTFNYMNGTKAKDPQNVASYFNRWFMHDEATKELLLSYTKLKSDQLPVTGHILQDTAEKHEYAGTLDAVSEKINGKKVIALFTSPMFMVEAQEVLNFLSGYLNKHTNCVVLVRKHPSEKDFKLVQHERMMLVPDYSERMVQASLFDLLLKSDIAISFSSMISFQASWFNTPSLNYELARDSRLSYVDNKRIFHVSSLAKLEAYLDDFLIKNGLLPQRKKGSNAADAIANILLSTEPA